MPNSCLPVVILILLSLTGCNLPSRLEEQPDEPIGLEDSLVLVPVSRQDTPQTLLPPYCPDHAPQPVTGLGVFPYPELPEPDAGIPFRDPVFGSCVVRVTDSKVDLAVDDPSKGMKNEYARVQSFNADGTKLMVRSVEAFWYLYDALALVPLAQLPLAVEPRWHPQNPNLVYFHDETRLYMLDVTTFEMKIIHDFAPDLESLNLSMVWTRYEGSPDQEGRTWGLMAQDDRWQVVAFLIYDIVLDKVTAVRFTPDHPEVDSVTISPSGLYFLAYFDNACEVDTPGDVDRPCGLMVYDDQLKNGRSMLPVIGHSDTALDTEGRDVLVYQDIRADTIAVLDLESGQVTPLWTIDFSHSPIGFHFSGRAFQTPGWALVSTYSGGYPQPYTWMDNAVFAIELAPSGRIFRLAHTHSVVDEAQEHDYWAEPQASVNPDFTRVVFTSNWGRSGSEAVELYLIELSEGIFAKLEE